MLKLLTMTKAWMEKWDYQNNCQAVSRIKEQSIFFNSTLIRSERLSTQLDSTWKMILKFKFCINFYAGEVDGRKKCWTVYEWSALMSWDSWCLKKWLFCTALHDETSTKIHNIRKESRNDDSRLSTISSGICFFVGFSISLSTSHQMQLNWCNYLPFLRLEVEEK